MGNIVGTITWDSTIYDDLHINYIYDIIINIILKYIQDKKKDGATNAVS